MNRTIKTKKSLLQKNSRHYITSQSPYDLHNEKKLHTHIHKARKMAQNRGGDTSKGLAVSFQRSTNFSSVGAFKGALLSHSNLNCIDSEKKRASGAAGIAFACANDGDDSPRLLWELLINCIAQLADILLMIGELKDNGFFMIGSYVIVVCSRLLSGAE